MPQLLNRRHEIFARALASGESASTAYRAAGYQCAPHKARGHGHRLRIREDIAARVQELIDKPQNRIATQQIVEAIRTGRPTIYRPELATLARKLALLGATDQEMADALGIDQGTLDRWKTRHKEFRIAIQLGKIRADAEIAESLYNRARGMSLPAVKIFQGTPEAGPVIVPHQQHLPPDVGAAKLWLSPFIDQADDARVADPVLDDADEPVLAHRIEEPGNIGVQNVVHLSAVNPDMGAINSARRPFRSRCRSSRSRSRSASPCAIATAASARASSRRPFAARTRSKADMSVA